ncbi:DUF4044 domain-containing protein [Streptococcus caprae]|uniref:DUF4044 domain-containing protein n=1 Tax=Streptococcus caprae TaxID=1640501 RepID=A0ABV8CUJ9_9STRE
MAFGDNGPRKKTAFEKLTMVLVIVMLVATLGALVVSAVSAFM